MNEPFSVLFVVGKMPPFLNNNGPHAPSSKANATLPPSTKKYHGPLGPLFIIYKSGTEYVMVPTSYISIVLTIYVDVY